MDPIINRLKYLTLLEEKWLRKRSENDPKGSMRIGVLVSVYAERRFVQAWVALRLSHLAPTQHNQKLCVCPHRSRRMRFVVI